MGNQSGFVMGIRVVCPRGHRLHLKAFLAGKRGLCPHCGARFRIPSESTDSPQPFAEPPLRGRDPVPGDAVLAMSTTAPLSDLAPVRPAQASDRSLVQTEVPQALPVVTTAHSGPGHPAATDTSVSFARSVETAMGPLDDDPSAAWFVRTPGGGQYGPASLDVMRDWIVQGRVSPQCLVWRVGWSEWQSASNILTGPDSTAATKPSHPEIDVASGDESLPFPVEPMWRHRENARRRSSGYGVVVLVILAALGLAVAAGLIYMFQTGQITLHAPV